MAQATPTRRFRCQPLGPDAALGATPTSKPLPFELVGYALDYRLLIRPCVDCGRWTGDYCEGVEEDDCFADLHMPGDAWAPDQRTPLCSVCEEESDACHYCREEAWARPKAWGMADPDEVGPCADTAAEAVPAADSPPDPAASASTRS